MSLEDSHRFGHLRPKPKPSGHTKTSLSPGTEQSSLQLVPGHPPTKGVFCSHGDPLHPNPRGKVHSSSCRARRVGLLHIFIGGLIHGPPNDLCTYFLRSCATSLRLRLGLSPKPVSRRRTLFSVRRSLLLTLGHEDQRQVRARAGARFPFPPLSPRVLSRLIQIRPSAERPLSIEQGYHQAFIRPQSTSNHASDSHIIFCPVCAALSLEIGPACVHGTSQLREY